MAISTLELVIFNLHCPFCCFILCLILGISRPVDATPQATGRAGRWWNWMKLDETGEGWNPQQECQLTQRNEGLKWFERHSWLISDYNYYTWLMLAVSHCPLISHWYPIASFPKPVWSFDRSRSSWNWSGKPPRRRETMGIETFDGPTLGVSGLPGLGSWGGGGHQRYGRYGRCWSIVWSSC